MGIGDWFKEVIERTKPVFEAVSVKPPTLLYHYTKISGLVGIISSRVLWATDIRYLNDAKEFHYAFEITRNVLMDLLDSSAPPSYAPLIPSLLAKIEAIDPFGVFVTCFTENGDLLSQWRGYCSPEVGCSIGWSGKNLQHAGAQGGFMLAPCIYDLDLQHHLVQDLLNRIFADESGRSVAGADPSSLLDFSLSLIAPLFKHPSFREEAEWRLFTRPSKATTMPLYFRLGRTTLIPYAHIPIETPHGTLADVERVMVGPTPLPALSAQAINACLINAKVIVHEVALSTTPYRNI